jgi:enoyl-CoA hydratase
VSDVLLSVTDDGVGLVRLNRPQAINALSVELFETLESGLTTWFEQGNLTGLDIAGEGSRGFCAGADVRTLRSWALEDADKAAGFLHLEYRVDRLVAEAPVPVTAHLHGVTMGGGVGLTLRAGRRITAPDLQWAMPEVQIGLWPDVGVTYEFARLPGELGVHLAMTGVTLDAGSALYAGLVDELADGADPEPLAAASDLARDAGWIAECYAGDDPAIILARLEHHPNERARAAAALIRTRCPLTVCVALAAIRQAAALPSLAATFDRDARAAYHSVREPDLVEGVRAQLVDKDKRPRWRHAWVEDVDPAEVAATLA